MSIAINIRVTKEEKKRLKEVAASEGKTLSAMLREAALAEARRVLREHKLHLIGSQQEAQMEITSWTVRKVYDAVGITPREYSDEIEAVIKRELLRNKSIDRTATCVSRILKGRGYTQFQSR